METQRERLRVSMGTLCARSAGYYTASLFISVGQMTGEEKVRCTSIIPAEKFGTNQNIVDFYKSSHEENRSEQPRDRSGFNLSFESLQTNPIIRHCSGSII